MKKTLLMIGYNFRPEPTGIGKYSGEMIYWLAEKGYHCTVITTYPYYPYWKVQEPYYKNRYWFKCENQEFNSGGRITIHRCPIYVPKKPSGKKRILLDFTFLLSASFKIISLLIKKKFDSVITVVPSFQVGLFGIIFKKLHKSKFLYHIQDMQIEAARDLKLIRSEKILRTLLKIERFIFKQSDCVSTVSEAMGKKIKEKAKKDVYILKNWVDIHTFKPLKNKDQLKHEFGFKNKDKIILYSGAIGEKQGLELLLNAAVEWKKNKNIKFVICGSGPYNEQLIDLQKNLHLDNFRFLPLQPLNDFIKLLNIADLHLVLQKAEASDLMMPSKLTSIFSVGGLALVTARKGSGLHNLINANDMGIVVEPDNQLALNNGIRKALGESWSLLTYNARLYAEKHLSKDGILESYEKFVLDEKAVRKINFKLLNSISFKKNLPENLN